MVLTSWVQLARFVKLCSIILSVWLFCNHFSIRTPWHAVCELFFSVSLSFISLRKQSPHCVITQRASPLHGTYLTTHLLLPACLPLSHTHTHIYKQKCTGSCKATGAGHATPPPPSPQPALATYLDRKI